MNLSKEDIKKLIDSQNEIILSRNASIDEREKSYKLKTKYNEMLKNFD